MNKFMQKLKGIKHFEWILAGSAIIIMLLIYLTTLGGSIKGKTSSNSDYEKLSSRDKIAYKMGQTLSQIDGVGKCIVYLNWESTDKATSSSLTNDNPNGKIISAVIVCQGALNGKVKLTVINTVSMMTSLKSDKISVLRMSNTG